MFFFIKLSSKRKHSKIEECGMFCSERIRWMRNADFGMSIFSTFQTCNRIDSLSNANSKLKKNSIPSTFTTFPKHPFSNATHPRSSIPRNVFFRPADHRLRPPHPHVTHARFRPSRLWRLFRWGKKLSVSPPLPSSPPCRWRLGASCGELANYIFPRLNLIYAKPAARFLGTNRGEGGSFDPVNFLFTLLLRGQRSWSNVVMPVDTYTLTKFRKGIEMHKQMNKQNE